MHPDPLTRGDAVYRFAQLIPRLVWGPLAGLRVEGVENVPPSGPFLLICNHQSNLDPILIQAVCPRAVHAMAKSNQFAAPVVGRIMKRLLSFPVRRYQADPQAVRYALRQLDRGEGVAIYIEGERTWDGTLQPPRLGTVRLALKAGVRGYIPTSTPLPIAMEAMRLVSAGGTYIPAECVLAASTTAIWQPTSHISNQNPFTTRQLQVVEALRRGKANKLIAYELNMCESTVKVHVRQIMKKLNARNRTEAAFKASQLLQAG